MRIKPTLILTAFLLVCNLVHSQTIVCEGSSCTANDYTLNYFYLGDAAGTPFGPGYCDPGTTVNAHIWTNFTANAAAPRYTLYLHFNLYVDGVFVATIDECYYEGQPIPTNVTLDLYNFDWLCGSVITLENFYMAWRPNASQECGCSNAKCYQEAVILVDAPLIANFAFEPSCLGAYTVQFFSTTTGGLPPYTWFWDFGDGNTSTEENPIHSFPDSGPYTVVLTVYDQENTDSQGYEVVDFDANLPPEITAPPSLNIEGCSVSEIVGLPLSTSTTSITEAEFNANGGSLIMSNDIVSLEYVDSVSGTCPIVVTRTYTVTDSCNNSSTDTQIFTINDTTAPTASNPASITVQCINNIPSPNINVVTDEADNCSSPTVEYIGEVSDNNTCPEIITRHYRVKDDCGNFVDVEQIIIVNDDVAPTASNPAQLHLQCSEDLPAPNINVVTDEADNCSTPTVAFVSENIVAGTCPMQITRIYSVTDDCGNQIQVTHMIIVDDTTPPSATGPSDITVQCFSQVPNPDINEVTSVADNCSTAIVEFVSDVTNNGSCPEVVTRTYSVTDECDNVTLITQEITVLDDVQPSANTPADINVQCIDDVPAPDISVISNVTDNCSNPVVSFISDVATGTCPQVITRTYRVADGCGNFIDIVQAINVTDDIPPTASNPPSMTLSCSDQIPVPNVNVVTDEADNCSTPTVTFISDVASGNCPEVITRTYRVRDACNNSIFVTQQFTFTDDEGPTLDSPLNDITVDCDAIPNVPNLNFSDNCSASVNVAYNETNTNNNDNMDYVIIREWTVTDNCGNVSVFTQTIDVIIDNCIVSACNSCGTEDDTIPPTASNPPDLVVDCTGSIPPPDPSVVTDAADNCVPPVVAFVSETVSVDCFEGVTRVYSVTDECGNVIFVTHNINVVDNEPPTASNPPALNLSCSDAIPAPNVNVVTDEADNCSVPVVTFVSDVSNNSCNEHIIRTYRVTDSCGNFILVTQEINVTDDVAPTASSLPNINISCINGVPIPNTNIITDEWDNCSVPTVSFISDISDNNTCPETITRTYRITDECGNFTDIIQLIIVNDDIPPTASNPNPIQVVCPSDIPAPNVNVVTNEADNCSTPVVAFVSDVSNNQSCPEIITRNYSVTDACGNSINVTQTITVNDEIDPTASNPIAIQVNQASEVPSPDVNVVTDEADNCGIPTVAFVSDTSDGQSCPETILRVYSVTDACGNSINVTQTIIIDDNNAPTASNAPSLTVQCIEDVPVVDVNVITDASDNTSTPLVTFVSETSNNQTCPEIITRIYSVTDDCGNSINVSHVIFVDDDILPTASNPASMSFNHISEVPAPDVEVVIDEADNCGVPTVTFHSEISNNDPCQEIITRIYRVTDACGNFINVMQEIIITDSVAPTADAPPTMNISCDLDIPAPDTNIINLTSDVDSATVEFISESSNNQTCPEIITRIYRVTDSCGNSMEVSHEISINDEEPPTASNPATDSYDSMSDVPAPNPEVVIDEADNCSVPTVAFVSESVDNSNPCAPVISRIYSVTDACDNSINVTHTINVNGDNQDPTASNPADLSLQCMANVPEPDIAVVTDAQDDASTPVVTFVSENVNNSECFTVIDRVYNVADACGNSIDVTHTIFVEDTEAPTVISSVDPQITVSCGEVPPIPSVGFGDNCSSDIIVDYNEEIVDVDGVSYNIVRTWTASDDCSNSTSVAQTIYMVNGNAEFENAAALCVSDFALNLQSFVENEGDNGVWTSDHMNLLDGTMLDPSTAPLGDYIFTYTVTNNECSSERHVYVNINDDCVYRPCIKSIADVDISKIVTPNNDNRNDMLMVGYILNEEVDEPCIIQIELQVFNRWGMLMYQDMDYKNDWGGSSPGTAIGASETLPTGSYYYIVNLVNSGLDPIQGYIYLGIE